MLPFYILGEDGEPVKVDLDTWVRWIATARAEDEPGTLRGRRIAAWERDGVRVSTVFLAVAHGHAHGQPILFESMVFGGVYDHEQFRYVSRESALKGHALLVDLVRAALNGADRADDDLLEISRLA